MQSEKNIAEKGKKKKKNIGRREHIKVEINNSIINSPKPSVSQASILLIELLSVKYWLAASRLCE